MTKQSKEGLTIVSGILVIFCSGLALGVHFSHRPTPTASASDTANQCVTILEAERKAHARYTRTILTRDDVSRDGCAESYSVAGTGEDVSCANSEFPDRNCCTLELLHTYQRPPATKNASPTASPASSE